MKNYTSLQKKNFAVWKSKLLQKIKGRRKVLPQIREELPVEQIQKCLCLFDKSQKSLKEKDK